MLMLHQSLFPTVNHTVLNQRGDGWRKQLAMEPKVFV